MQIIFFCTKLFNLDGKLEFFQPLRCFLHKLVLYYQPPNQFLLLILEPRIDNEVKEINQHFFFFFILCQEQISCLH